MSNPDSTSAEKFAEYAFKQIPKDIDNTLTDVQKIAIKKAIIKQFGFQRHALDIRVTLPLFFWRFYLVILAGRDRRGFIRDNETRRKDELTERIQAVIFSILMTLLILSASLAVFIGLYIWKTQMGIDIFPGTHLSDIFPSITWILKSI